MAVYQDACSLLQKSTRKLQSNWWEQKAEELQRAADRNDMKDFYQALKEVWGPQRKGPVHLESSDGKEIFSDSKRVLERWTEHFQKLLNVPGDIEPTALANIQHHNVMIILDETPTMEELMKAVASLADGKAPGGDRIPAKSWRHGELRVTSRLLKLIHKAWEEDSVPQEWKDANAVTNFKKGDRTDCGKMH